MIRTRTTSPLHVRAALLVLVLTALALPATAQQVTLDWKETQVGQVRQVLTNFGTLLGHGAEFGYPGSLQSEYPAGSFEEHIGEGGFWFGGITPENDTLVTTSLSWDAAPFWETYPSDAPWDSIWVVARGDTVDIGDPADPYLPGYVGVSDQDFVMRYSDYGAESLRHPRHTPLYLDITQTVYTWSAPDGLDDVLLYTWEIVPNEFDIRAGYFTFWLDPNVGQEEGVGAAFFQDDYASYVPDLHLAMGHDAEGGQDGTAVSPVGVMLLPPEGYSESELRYSWHWGSDPFAPGMIPPDDADKYADLMATGEIMPDQQRATGAHFTLSVGPFDLAVGDTLRIQAAQLFSEEGAEGVVENARLLRRLREQEFRFPAPPPQPPLQAIPGDHHVELIWEPVPEQNPETYTDPNRADDVEQPFEGYRVYKSTVGPEGPWTLLAEYDVADDGYASDFGLRRHLTDNRLINNVAYYYSVTAFSKEDRELNWPALETSIAANAVRVVPGTPPPDEVGQVAVVPNPYRGDIAYQDYDPAWERPSGDRQTWLEQDRRLQFINLPPRARITVYTVAGDRVATLRHDDPVAGYEDWNLTSDVGQAIASGIYVFSVENLDSGEVQVGKFVVIK